MSQPIRRAIQEAHPDLMKEEPIYTLLVDGNSLLFMCFKDGRVNSDGVHYGGVYQFLLHLRQMMQKKDFDYVYVFFDSEYSGYERWKYFKPYKANRDKHYADYGVSDYMKRYNENLKSMQRAIFEKQRRKGGCVSDGLTAPKTKSEVQQELMDANFDRERDILCRYFNELFIRWNIDDTTEGDDQIAYYCNHKKPNEKIIIVSGDMDLSQLLNDDVAIYNLRLKKFVTTSNFKELFGYHYSNVLTKKIFTGDSSDNISNIKGLSEDGLMELMPEIATRPVTVMEVIDRARELIDGRKAAKKKPLKLHENIVAGVSNKAYDGDFYEINRKIIDLSHPLMSAGAEETMEAMMYAPMDPDGRSFTNLYRYVLEDGITEFRSDTRFAEFFNVFKRLDNKERTRYAEYVKNGGTEGK